MAKRKSVTRLALSLAAVTVLSFGCKKEQIRVYNAPKDNILRQAEAEAESRPVQSHRQRPQISYKIPANWKEVPPSEISLASFKVEGAKGQEANVSVTQLANLEGKDAEIVNMWRQQVGLDMLSRDEALKQLQPVQVAAHKGSLFEISSESNQLKIVTAVVHEPEGSWFYKLSGDTAVVDKEKPAFLDFLQTIQVKAMASASPAGQGHEDHFHWTVPPSWKAVAPKQMQVARFSVPEKGDATAEVSVSVFPGDTGGTLANVNRWRRQLQLKEVGETELSGLVKPLDPGLPGSILVDMTNNDRRMVGAIVPRGERYWFYKLMGDATAVGPEKDAFIGFAQSKPE